MRRPQPLILLAVILVTGIVVLPMAGSTQSAEPAARIQHDGPFKNPLPGHRILQGYGEFKDPFNGEKLNHKGVDLPAKTGTPVLASLTGTVITAKTHQGYGKYIRLQHENDFTTVYAHLDTILVHTGDRVTAGDKIGLVGSTGKSTGPHLHFEIRKSGTPVNPESLITF